MWPKVKSAVFLMLFYSVFGSMCPGDENTKKKFLIIEEEANWYGALLSCNSRGMALATIQSQQEQDQLENLIKQSYVTHPEDNNSENNRWWLGAASLHDGLEFVWFSTGEVMYYNNFRPGNPTFSYNGIEEQCVELRDTQGWNHQWNDAPCWDKIYFVCEHFEQTKLLDVLPQEGITEQM